MLGTICPSKLCQTEERSPGLCSLIGQAMIVSCPGAPSRGVTSGEQLPLAEGDGRRAGLGPISSQHFLPLENECPDPKGRTMWHHRTSIIAPLYPKICSQKFKPISEKIFD